MVKLTADLIENCNHFINPVRDRELDLRGYKLPAIENLGATYDQFDVIDFCDNDIRKLDGFPYLPRLKSLLLHNNRVARIAENLAENIPNLSSLYMHYNNMQELGDLEPLTSLKNLEYLSLLGNPVANNKEYRLFVIYKMPQIRVLDYRRVRLVERKAARERFRGKKGKDLQEKIVKKTTFIPGEPVTATANNVGAAGPSAGAVRVPPHMANMPQRSAEDIQAIKEAIASAKSLEEVERLTQMLNAGHIPGRQPPPKKSQANGQHGTDGEAIVETEEDDMEL